MRKFIIFLSIILTVSPYIIFAEKSNIENWQFEKEIILKDDSEYKAVILDKDIYKGSNMSLSDIRIIDQDDEFIPYYIVNKYETIEETSDYTISLEENNTNISILNPNKLKIFKIELFTDDMFRREYEVHGDNDSLLEWGTIHSNENGNIINLDDHLLGEVNNIFNIIILNRDDKPINIDNIVISYHIDKLVLKANRENKYRIIYGNMNSTTPFYDIISYKDSIEVEKQELALLGELIERPISDVMPKEFNIKAILNIVVIISSFVLIAFIIKHISKK